MMNNNERDTDNTMCYKVTKFTSTLTELNLPEPEKMFSCVWVYTGLKEGQYYSFVPGMVGLDSKVTLVTPLIE